MAQGLCQGCTQRTNQSCNHLKAGRGENSLLDCWRGFRQASGPAWLLTGPSPQVPLLAQPYQTAFCRVSDLRKNTEGTQRGPRPFLAWPQKWCPLAFRLTVFAIGESLGPVHTAQGEELHKDVSQEGEGYWGPFRGYPPPSDVLSDRHIVKSQFYCPLAGWPWAWNPTCLNFLRYGRAFVMGYTHWVELI